MGKPMLTLKDLKKLPYATTLFSVIREKEKVYVDKTAMIARIAETEDAPVFLSRPRRFGKSLLVSAFESLFSRGLQDFKGLDIDTGEEKWTDKTYKVVRLDFSLYADDSCEELIQDLTQDLVDSFADIKTINPLDPRGNYQKPSYVLKQGVKDADPKSIVLLIDEYDSPVSHHLNNKDETDKIMNLIKSFFFSFKRLEEKLSFVFII